MGFRLSEIQFLRREYVKEDCIELPGAKTGGRVVPLGPEARAVLKGLAREDDNPWVITGIPPGSHLTDLQRPWRRIRARAGLEDVRIHDLRHTCPAPPYHLAACFVVNYCNKPSFTYLAHRPDFAKFRSVYKRSADWSQFLS